MYYTSELEVLNKKDQWYEHTFIDWNDARNELLIGMVSRDCHEPNLFV